MTRSEIRQRAEDLIEQLIALVDQIDGDPEAEIETDFDLNPISLQGVDRVPAKNITMRRVA
ncbi:hypothetical protein [Devosia sp.]|uniref:hypothetical protein n=1 Tax=Devosia sp. TaxID=1871048 RepID=UPI001ACF1F7D|nr:hypothetical protein [Devosia sp.]MBN9333271.1 hypothetical protein [Devosia sp.]